MKQSIMTFIVITMSITLSALGQITVKVTPAKSQYLVGEVVKATVTVSNHTKAPITFRNEGALPWLDIYNVKLQPEQQLPQIRTSNFPPITVSPGVSKSISTDLRNLSDFSREGNYTTFAIVRTRNFDTVFPSNKAHFKITAGLSIRSLPAATPKGQRIIYSVMGNEDNNGQKLYAQLKDADSKEVIHTEPLGAWVTQMTPETKVDAQAYLHVFFMSTPMIYCHTIVDSSGKTLKRNYYDRSTGSVPTLIFIDGTFRVVGASYRNPKAKSSPVKTRKASQIPL